MRKKVGNEEYGGRRSVEREESMHRRAAALAWYRHGRKGTTFLGSGRGGKMNNPLLHAPRRHHGGSDQASGSYNMEKERSYREITDMGGGLVAPQSNVRPYTLSLNHQDNLSAIHQQASLSPTLQGNLSPLNQQASLSPTLQGTLPPLHQSPVHQASRFKAEALALKSSSSSSSSSSPSPSTSSSMMNMSTGQSLALLSLLPHQQSQKCFNLSNKEYAGDCSSSNNNNNNNNNNTTPWDCGSSLYDSFELLCLSNQLGRCLTTVNASAMVGSSSPATTPSSTSSSCKKVLKNLAPPLQGPSLQPSYIPRSLYALPQFMIPSYLATKSAKKRSSLIHPIFSSSIPTTINISTPSSSSSLSALPSSLHNQIKKSHPATEDHLARKKAESGGGFRRVFNSLLKSLHIKEDSAHQKPKRSNLSEELEKLPKNRPSSSRGALLYDSAPAADMASSKRPPTSSSSSSGAAMASRRSPTSASPSPSSYQYQYHHHFRNEGFRTTYKPPKSVKWVQPGAS